MDLIVERIMVAPQNSASVTPISGMEAVLERIDKSYNIEDFDRMPLDEKRGILKKRDGLKDERLKLIIRDLEPMMERVQHTYAYTYSTSTRNTTTFALYIQVLSLLFEPLHLRR